MNFCSIYIHHLVGQGSGISIDFEKKQRESIRKRFIRGKGDMLKVDMSTLVTGWQLNL